MGARRSKTSKAEKDQQRIAEILKGLDDEYPDVPDNLDFLSDPEQDIALVDYLLQYTQASEPNRV